METAAISRLGQTLPRYPFNALREPEPAASVPSTNCSTMSQTGRWPAGPMIRIHPRRSSWRLTLSLSPRRPRVHWNDDD